MFLLYVTLNKPISAENIWKVLLKGSGNDLKWDTEKLPTTSLKQVYLENNVFFKAPRLKPWIIAEEYFEHGILHCTISSYTQTNPPVMPSAFFKPLKRCFISSGFVPSVLHTPKTRI